MVSDTVRRIEVILDRINTHPEYSAVVKRDRLEAIRTEAARHSCGIEKRSEANFNLENNREHDPKLIFGDISKAWEYLANYGIDVHSLNSIPSIIEPSLKDRGYRKKEVNLGIPAIEVPYQMEKFAGDLNDFEMFPSIKRAIHAHLELLRIHPYMDGNGRAARLLSNFCLEQRGYPSVIIPEDERELYMDLIRGSLNSRFKENSTTLIPRGIESTFHSYIESKILHSVKDLEDELKNKRVYDLQLSNVENPGVLESVKRMIRGVGRRGDHEGLVVNLTRDKGSENRGGRSLEVRGDISLVDLNTLLQTCSDKYNIKYFCNIRKGCC
jgi:hypothetical protein